MSNYSFDEPQEIKIITKDSQAILDEIDFKSIDDRLVCESIIDNLEKEMAEDIKNIKAVQMPLIGTIRINPVKRKIRKSKLNFKIARANLTKEQYKEHVSTYIEDIKEEQKNIDNLKLIFKRIKTNNKKKYDVYCREYGLAYAKMFLYSIYLLKDVPFDAEWEEQYSKFKDYD